jgi:beta-phosphoglucomutase-like phosphatase (HAD superfamily)
VIPCGALLFDMDGLMVDSEPLWFDVERGFARERGGNWTAEHALACTGQGMANTLRVMHERLGLVVDVERDEAEIVRRFMGRVGELELKTGFLELFAAASARGLPRALASSSPLRLVEATAGRFGLLARFGAVVSGDCVPLPKPAPDIFVEAARRLGVPASACVVLEDSLAGMRAGRAAGMRVIGVPEAVVPEMRSLADAIVGDLHEAHAFLAFE